jgi:hypothetical protein
MHKQINFSNLCSIDLFEQVEFEMFFISQMFVSTSIETIREHLEEQTTKTKSKSNSSTATTEQEKT